MQSQLGLLKQQLEQQRADAESATAALRTQLQQEAAEAAATAAAAARLEAAEQARAEAATRLGELESSLQEAVRGKEAAEAALQELEEQADRDGQLQVGRLCGRGGGDWLLVPVNITGPQMPQGYSFVVVMTAVKQELTCDTRHGAWENQPTSQVV